MNKYGFTVILLLVICIFGYSDSALAKSWHFVEWYSDITINNDSTFVVRETQTVQFEGEFSFLQRGISLHNIKKISDVIVYDVNMNPLPPEQFDIKKSGNEVVVKINFHALNEIKTWTFEYKVYGGIGYFKDYDEIYWNAISQERDVYIDSEKVIVHLPQDAVVLEQKLFIGAEGSQNEYGTRAVIDKRTLLFWGKDIPPYTHFTIVGAFPKGVVKRNWWLIISPLLWLIIPLIAFPFLLWLWWNKGKDPKAKEVIIPQYEPPIGLSPAEMSAVINEKFRTRDISATLIDLACRGYIKVIDNGVTSGDYTFQKQKDITEDKSLKKHERIVLNGIFGIRDVVDLVDLKDKFYTNIPKIKKAVFEQITLDGYFNQNPLKIWITYSLVGIILIVLSIILAVIRFVPVTGLIAFILTGIMILVFGHFMPCKTQKGSETKWHALGFKEYLQVAEKFRLEVNVDPKTFDKYLSYALVFGVVVEWANRFSLIYRDPPDWYVSSYDHGTFSFVHFSGGLSNMEHSFSSVLPSAPSSSSSGMGGGGSAGGGGGGGSSSAG
jgi:uncharacterized membrane protein